LPWSSWVTRMIGLGWLSSLRISWLWLRSNLREVFHAISVTRFRCAIPAFLVEAFTADTLSAKSLSGLVSIAIFAKLLSKANWANWSRFTLSLAESSTRDTSLQRRISLAALAFLVALDALELSCWPDLAHHARAALLALRRERRWCGRWELVAGTLLIADHAVSFL
jgi:L-lactate permease